MYSIDMFDGLLLSPFMVAGDEQNIGTGQALTSYQQLPGGGFLDNYGTMVSPQGIRPITKSCLLWGDTHEELKAMFDNLRGKIGVTGKLTARFDDGTQRWQWARLQNINNPRPLTAKANWLPCELTWITASQRWYGLIWTATGWSVGDDSFYIGDGTTGLGQTELTFAFTSTPTDIAITHNGSLDATNLEMEIYCGGTSITAPVITNLATGQRIAYSGNLATGESLFIRTADKSIFTRSAPLNITSISRSGLTLTVTTSSAHGLANGGSVYIAGAGLYDGYWHNVTVSDTTTFTAPVSVYNVAFGALAQGTVARVVDAYNNATIPDKVRWIVLAPGLNTLRVSATGVVGANSIMVRFYEHYA